MDVQALIRELKIANQSKIVFLVADGLGGLPIEPGGPTELEAAKTPNLDNLAKHGVQGSMYPVGMGITPGSGPGHLSLFGYDPVKHLIGRGALEATGVGFKLGRNDVAVRCNFCTLDAQGKITDRRAGRIPTEGKRPAGRHASASQSAWGRAVCRAGQGTPVRRGLSRRRAVWPCSRHRSADNRRAAVWTPWLTMRRAKKRPRWPSSSSPGRKKLLADQPKANGLTMRGFAAAPVIDSYKDVYGLKAAAIAVYPRCTRAWPNWSAWRWSASRKRSRKKSTCLNKSGKTTTSSSFISSTPTAGARDGNFQEKVRMIEQFRRHRAARHGLEADGARRHRRSQHACPAGQPQLASGAGAIGGRHMPARRADGIRRATSASRRTGPFHRRTSHAAGDGACRAAGEVRSVM